jgi:enamine deaminase RidA (YjgF/YER057c/UK114 family)
MPRDNPALRFLNPPTMPPAAGYSHIAEVTGGRLIFLSGQVAVDEAGKPVGPNDMAAQARQVFTNLKSALEAAGTDFAHVIKLTFYLVDISKIALVRGIRDEFVDTRHPPASTAVEIRRLVREEFLIEVDAVAAAPV